MVERGQSYDHDPETAKLIRPGVIEYFVRQRRIPIFVERGSLTFCYFPPTETYLEDRFELKDEEMYVYNRRNNKKAKAVKRIVGGKEKAEELKQRRDSEILKWMDEAAIEGRELEL